MNRRDLRRKNIYKLLFFVSILIIINILAQYAFFRIDLTSEKRYTLSKITKNHLKNLQGSVYVKVYLDGPELPVGYKRLKNAIKEQLDEFEVYAGTNLDYTFINPSESNDKDVRFALYKELYDKGIKPIEINSQDQSKTTKTMIFPSAVITYTVSVPIQNSNPQRDTVILREIGLSLLKTNANLSAEDEQNIFYSIENLEFELLNAIHKLSQINKPQIAFVEGHNEVPELELADISYALSEYFDVRRGAINGREGVLDKFAAVIIAKPTLPFSEKDKYILDQYIMNGGRVLWLIDGVSVDMDSLLEYPVTVAVPNELNLSDMLFKYGVRINTNLVADLQCAPIGLATSETGTDSKIQLFPWMYFPLLLSPNTHATTRYLSYVKTEFASTIDTVGLMKGVQKKLLLFTSQFTKRINTPAPVSFDNIYQKPDPGQFRLKNLPVAVLLEGNFESAFLNRPVKMFTNSPENFIEQSKLAKMIVVADGDIIRNGVSPKGEPYPLGFDRNAQTTFTGNKEFIVNALNYLCDQSDIMSLRNREIKVRLLNKKKVLAEKSQWKIFNVLFPLVLMALFGLGIVVVRRRKYTR